MLAFSETAVRFKKKKKSIAFASEVRVVALLVGLMLGDCWVSHASQTP